MTLSNYRSPYKAWAKARVLYHLLTAMPSDGSCARFNNATQRVYGGQCTPVVYVWETNDPDNRWCAEARLVKFAQSSASSKQRAKDIAANTAWLALCAQYPHLDLINV
ncbi:hypothetical protein MD484_g5497, partial [Candolleomyces efflorescens]